MAPFTRVESLAFNKEAVANIMGLPCSSSSVPETWPDTPAGCAKAAPVILITSRSIKDILWISDFILFVGLKFGQYNAPRDFSSFFSVLKKFSWVSGYLAVF